MEFFLPFDTCMYIFNGQVSVYFIMYLHGMADALRNCPPFNVCQEFITGGCYGMSNLCCCNVFVMRFRHFCHCPGVVTAVSPVV